MTDQHMMIPVAALIPHGQNIRENVTPELQELADSIKEHGVLQPLLVVRKPPRPGSTQEYTIIAGHRRARAAMLAGKVTVPCTVRDATESSQDIVLMLVENTQRKDLNPIEQALALSALMLQGKSQKELARMLGRSEPWISNRLALLELSEVNQRRLVTGEMTMRQAEHLIRSKRSESKSERKEINWLPPHFTPRHPLAKTVKAVCIEREHDGRQRVGGVGCGQCWEWAIRTDERRALEAERNLLGGQAADTPAEGDAARV